MDGCRFESGSHYPMTIVGTQCTRCPSPQPIKNNKKESSDIKVHLFKGCVVFSRPQKLFYNWCVWLGRKPISTPPEWWDSVWVGVEPAYPIIATKPADINLYSVRKFIGLTECDALFWGRLIYYLLCKCMYLWNI